MTFGHYASISLCVLGGMALAVGLAIAFFGVDERAPQHRRRLFAWAAGFVALACLLVFSAGAAHADAPRAAAQYRHALTANARLAWGMSAPIATFAGQVHQESGWKPDARSPYAGGLAQFTPDTADWIGGVFPELAERQPFNPSWALRALVRYDRWLWERTPAATDCDRMAFALAAYNGGLGWIQRERRAAEAHGTRGDRWWKAVEQHCLRATWACKENRHYPAVILQRHQLLYAAWGPTTPC